MRRESSFLDDSYFILCEKINIKILIRNFFYTYLFIYLFTLAFINIYLQFYIFSIFIFSYFLIFILSYIDECEQFFNGGGKKNKDKDGPSRFKKDLLLYKNQAIGPQHRVIIIGTSKIPEMGDTKELKAFFDKFLYFPYPDYSSRRLVLKSYLEHQICRGKNKNILNFMIIGMG